jgi:hypothetical protein
MVDKSIGSSMWFHCKPCNLDVSGNGRLHVWAAGSRPCCVHCGSSNVMSACPGPAARAAPGLAAVANLATYGTTANAATPPLKNHVWPGLYLNYGVDACKQCGNLANPSNLADDCPAYYLDLLRAEAPPRLQPPIRASCRSCRRELCAELDAPVYRTDDPNVCRNCRKRGAA